MQSRKPPALPVWQKRWPRLFEWLVSKINSSILDASPKTFNKDAVWLPKDPFQILEGEMTKEGVPLSPFPVGKDDCETVGLNIRKDHGQLKTMVPLKDRMSGMTGRFWGIGNPRLKYTPNSGGRATGRITFECPAIALAPRVWMPRG